MIVWCSGGYLYCVVDEFYCLECLFLKVRTVGSILILDTLGLSYLLQSLL